MPVHCESLASSTGARHRVQAGSSAVFLHVSLRDRVVQVTRSYAQENASILANLRDPDLERKLLARKDVILFRDDVSSFLCISVAQLNNNSGHNSIFIEYRSTKIWSSDGSEKSCVSFN